MNSFEAKSRADAFPVPLRRQLREKIVKLPKPPKRVIAALCVAGAILAYPSGSSQESSPPEKPDHNPITSVEPTIPDDNKGVNPTIPAGFPNESTTGVPDGVKLEKTGGMTITTDNTVIQGKDIRGCVKVFADNVTIKNSKITCGGSPAVVHVDGDSTGLKIESTEIDGLKKAQNGVAYKNFVLYKVNIHGVVDGIQVGDNSTVSKSYVHDLVRTIDKRTGDKSHNDTVQAQNGGTNINLDGNTFLVYNFATKDPMNAAFMAEAKPEKKQILRDVFFTNNYSVGGNCTLNAKIKSHIVNFVIEGNTFGGLQRHCTIRSQPGVIVRENKEVKSR